MAEDNSLLSILLLNPLFAENNELMIDELLTIFFAGSQTSANVTANLIMQLCKHPDIKHRILTELEQENYTLYGYCFNEALRMQPPVYYSSSIRMTKDVDAAGLKIRKHDWISIGMGALCNDPKVW